MKRREFISGLGAVAWPLMAPGAARIPLIDRERDDDVRLRMSTWWHTLSKLERAGKSEEDDQ